MDTLCIQRTARLRGSSFGRTSSGSARRSVRWGKRRAESGYSVLVVNRFAEPRKRDVVSACGLRRSVDAGSADGATPFAHAENRDHPRESTDGMARSPTVVDRSRKMATTGYCISQHASKCTKERCTVMSARFSRIQPRCGGEGMGRAAHAAQTCARVAFVAEITWRTLPAVSVNA